MDGENVQMKKTDHRCIRTAQERRTLKRNIRIGVLILAAVLLIAGVLKIADPEWLGRGYFELTGGHIDASKPEIDVELLTVNPYSRPGTETDRITGIVVHYTANPGATAMENRNYFEGLKDSHAAKSSSNFIVGLEGEIIQCVPTWEVAYASNDRNHDTISIECCHPDESGEFNWSTYRSMVQLCAWLCLKFDLGPEDVIRHHDVTGKNCPKYFVEHEDAWEQFRADIQEALDESAQ